MTESADILRESENCPKCEAKLPLRLFTGRLVCSKCGWTDRPKIDNNLISQTSQIPQSEIALHKSPIHSMKGVQDLLEVFEDKVTIAPKGVLGFMNKGLKGTKTIPFSSISAIQFKEAGAVFSGYLQFTIPGGNESKGGVFSAASDENTFMFAEKKNNVLATQIKDFIEIKVQELRTPRVTQSQITTSLSDELQKLASLRDNGILTDQEFQSAKSRLISG
jgi:ribosomal protein S27AE